MPALIRHLGQKNITYPNYSLLTSQRHLAVSVPLIRKVTQLRLHRQGVPRVHGEGQGSVPVSKLVTAPTMAI